jgi:hypothetical protein
MSATASSNSSTPSPPLPSLDSSSQYVLQTFPYIVEQLDQYAWYPAKARLTVWIRERDTIQSKRQFGKDISDHIGIADVGSIIASYSMSDPQYCVFLELLGWEDCDGSDGEVGLGQHKEQVFGSGIDDAKQTHRWQIRTQEEMKAWQEINPIVKVIGQEEEKKKETNREKKKQKIDDIQSEAETDNKEENDKEADNANEEEEENAEDNENDDEEDDSEMEDDENSPYLIHSLQFRDRCVPLDFITSDFLSASGIQPIERGDGGYGIEMIYKVIKADVAPEDSKCKAQYYYLRPADLMRALMQRFDVRTSMYFSDDDMHARMKNEFRQSQPIKLLQIESFYAGNGDNFCHSRNDIDPYAIYTEEQIEQIRHKYIVEQREELKKRKKQMAEQGESVESIETTAQKLEEYYQFTALKLPPVACQCDRHPYRNISYRTLAQCIAAGTDRPWLVAMEKGEIVDNTHWKNWPDAGFHK